MPSQRRALFLSLRPEYAELVLTGSKTVELRRRRPKVRPGTAVLLYASSPVRALVGTAVVEGMGSASRDEIWERHGAVTGLSRQQYDAYFAGSDSAIAIMLGDISRLVTPVPLAALREGRPWFRPPQSFRYLDAAQVDSLNLGRMHTQLSAV